jgi:hypothetical protein
MKLLRKAFDFVIYAIGGCAMLLVSASVFLLPGGITLAFIQDFFSSDWFADHWVLRLIAAAPISALEIFAGCLLWRACKKKRALEEEIKTLSDMQILEPPPPDPVERFYGHDGPVERFLVAIFRGQRALGTNWASYWKHFL